MCCPLRSYAVLELQWAAVFVPPAYVGTASSLVLCLSGLGAVLMQCFGLRPLAALLGASTPWERLTFPLVALGGATVLSGLLTLALLCRRPRGGARANLRAGAAVRRAAAEGGAGGVGGEWPALLEGPRASEDACHVTATSAPLGGGRSGCSSGRSSAAGSPSAGWDEARGRLAMERMERLMLEGHVAAEVLERDGRPTEAAEVMAQAMVDAKREHDRVLSAGRRGRAGAPPPPIN